MARDPSKPASGSGTTRITKPAQGFTHEHVEGFTHEHVEDFSPTPQSGPKRGGDSTKKGAPVKK